MKLKGKVAAVTGAGSGIGRAIARLFAKEGASVGVIDCVKEAGGKVVDEIRAEGGEAIFVEADVSRVPHTERMIRTIVDNFGSLNILVNNAGVELVRHTWETTEDEWNRVIDVNLKGVFFSSKAAIPEITRSGGGSIINISSVNAVNGLPDLVAYSASKGGVLAMTIAMAKELAPRNIRVNAILPGAVDTPMLRVYLDAQPDPAKALEEMIDRHLIRRVGRPEDIAKAALYLASDDAEWVTGIALVVDGGYLIRF
ncbi:Dihydroanticapsin 7-dehydrogenase [archaeon HR01]|nr:Dihydroanticapsin 7-dehydrogenase [archaeon HR01]